MTQTMDAKTKSKLIQMYKKSKSDKSLLKSGKKNKKKRENKQTKDGFNAALNAYLSMATQTNVPFLQLPLQIIEIIFYDYFFPFQRYTFIPVCKLFMYFIDDTLQSTLAGGVNDHRIHNFELNAYYFYNNFDEFVVPISNSIVLDLSNETLRMLDAKHKQFLSYFFMYQSKLSLLYRKEILSSKYKKYKKRHDRRKKHNMDCPDIKSHYEILYDFVRIVTHLNKVICGGNAIWFHVHGMDIFGPILYSKYCQISSLSIDRNYINDEILLLFCKSLLFRNVLYPANSLFYDCKFLKRLDLSHNNNISDIGLNTLFAVIGEKCPNLQEIYLSNLSSITNLTCKIIYKFYQLFMEQTRLKMIVLNRNKFIDENGINVLNDLFKNNVIDIGQCVSFFVAQCGVDKKSLYNNSWDQRIKLEMPKK